MSTLRPGDLIGLPAIDPIAHSAAFRYVLLFLALVWALSWRYGRAWTRLLIGIIWIEVILIFWIATFGRPYGLLVDASSTRWIADVATSRATADPGESFLSGETAGALTRKIWSAWPLPFEVAPLLPTLLPVIVLPLVALGIVWLWAARPHAILAACLWLAFQTGDLDGVGGFGFLTGIWARPGAALVFVVTALAAIAWGRIRWREPWATVFGALALFAVWLLAPPVSAHPGILALLRSLTFEQGLWFPMGVVGLFVGADRAACTLVIAGAALSVGNALGLPTDLWGAQALYRLGLVLASTSVIVRTCDWVQTQLAAARPTGAAPGGSTVLAFLLLVSVPGSFPAWWDPIRMDPVAAESVETLPSALLDSMRFIREHTPREAVFMASPEYSAAIASLAGRRVLRAPSLSSGADEGRRARTERLVLAGQAPASLLRLYGLRYLFLAPGDFRQQLASPDNLTGRPDLHLLFEHAEGFRVYEIVVGAAQP